MKPIVRSSARPRPAALLLAALLPLLAPAGAQQPDTPEQLERRAQDLYAADRLEEAADLYLRLAESAAEPAEQARALVLAAWLQTLRGRPDLADQTLRRALLRDPSHRLDAQSFSEEFQRRFEELRAQGSSGGLPSGSSLQEGLRLLQQDDLIGARAVFDEAASLDPGDAQVQFLLARIESRLGETEASQERLQRLAARLERGERLSVRRAQVDAELGITAYRSGDPGAAARAFARAVEADPADVTSWHNLGLARNQLGDAAGAAESFRRALELDADRPALRHLLAQTLLQLGEHAEGRSLLRALTAEGSDDPRVWRDLGSAEQRAGDSEAAGRAFERAASLDPGNEQEIAAPALAQWAAVLLDAGDHRGAVEVARKALRLEPTSVDALNVLGLSLIELGETAQAATELERARALAPQRADLANNLGKALFAADRLEESIEAFQAALELAPDLEPARANLEVARRRLESGGVTPEATAAGTPREEAPPPAAAPSELGASFADVRHAGTGRDAVEVTAVSVGGLAELAGLRAGDLILRVGGRGIGARGLENAAAVRALLSDLAPGESVRLDLFRGPEALALTVSRR
ncbi:MAG TPA: tetratricopeptide repeat protein [Thermoanaerobaculia bacterium]|nr:tetratricopeptide repeat protein [Thermoanaerobaculia bacterium]